MTELYATLDGGGETQAVFSTLEKAKTAVEAHIMRDIREDRYAYDADGPLPELSWRQESDGRHLCGFVRANPPMWWSCTPELFPIPLDPEEIE